METNCFLFLFPRNFIASDSLGTGLEDLQIDVKSRFEMFEKKKSDDADLGGADKIQGPPVKR